MSNIERTASGRIIAKNKVMILYANPDTSGTDDVAKTLESVIKGIEAKGKEYEIVDLYKDKFDPVYHGKDLAKYAVGDTTRADIEAYQDKVREVNEMAVIYPTEWGGMPAIMKGWWDQVFLDGDFWGNVHPWMVFGFLWGTTQWVRRVRIYAVNQKSKKRTGAATKKGITRGTCRALRMGNVYYHEFDNASKHRETGTAKAEALAAKYVELEAKIKEETVDSPAKCSKRLFVLGKQQKKETKKVYKGNAYLDWLRKTEKRASRTIYKDGL